MDKPQTTATSSQDGQQQSPDTTTPSDSYPYGMEEFFRRYFGGMAS